MKRNLAGTVRCVYYVWATVFLGITASCLAVPQRNVLSLPLNTVAHGSISLPEQQDRFVFSGNAGDRLYFDTFDLEYDAIRVRLVAPSGEEWGINQPDYWESTPFYLLENGNYTLVVDRPDGGVGDYNFRVVNVATAPEIALGSTNSVSLNPSTRTEIFQFTATAGTRIDLETVTNAVFNGTWLLVAPNNQVIAQSSLYYGLGTNLLPVTGTYLVLVRGDMEVDSPLDFAFAIHDVSDPTTTYSGFNLTRYGTVAAGATNANTFKGNAGTPVVYDSQVSGSSIEVEIKAPDGTVILRQDGTGSSSPFFLPRSGTYTVRIIGNGGGDFRYKILNLWSNSLPITLGATNASTLAGYAEQWYRYDAIPGQMVFYDGLPGTASYNRVYSPQLDYLRWRSMMWDDQMRVATPGTYFLCAENDTPDTAVATFRQLERGQSPALPLAFNTVVTNKLANNSSIMLYRFEGVQGQRLFMETTNFNYDIHYAFIDPTGAEIGGEYFASDLNLVLTRSGTYSLVLKGNQDSPKVDFAFRLNTPATSTNAIAIGQITGGTIGHAGDAQAFTFDGAAGQRLLLNIVQADSGDIPVRLYGPRGNVCFLDQYTGNSVGHPFTLIEPGQYTLTFGTGRATGQFQFRLFDINQSPVMDLPYAQAVTISNMPGMMESVFRLPVVAGQRLFLDVMNTSGESGEYFYGYWPNNNIAFSTSCSDIDTVVQQTGTMLLVVGSSETNAMTAGFRVLAPCTTTWPLSLNTDVSNSFETPGQDHVFTFSASKGQRLFFNALDRDWDNVQVTIRDRLANNTIVNNYDSYNSSLFTISASGDYDLVLHNGTDGTPDYGFVLLDLAAQSHVAINTTNTGRLENQNQARFYWFDGAPGQRVRVDMSFVGPLSAYWWVAGPNNVVLPQRRINDTSCLFDLPVAGAYAICIESSHGGLDYQFSITDVSDAPVPPSGFGGFSGTINYGETNLHYFNAPAGMPILLDDLANNYSVNIQCVDTNGVAVYQSAWMSGDRCYVLPSSGTYRFEVTSYSGGEYSFRILNLAEAPLLAYGSNMVASLTNYQTEVFRFAGTAGERIIYDGSRDLEDSQYQVLTPSGYYAFSNLGNRDLGPITLTESGMYYLLLQLDREETKSGAFRLVDLAQSPLIQMHEVIGQGLSPVPASNLVITGSYFNQVLGSESDWRVTQTAAGTRADAMINFATTNWGSLAEVGLTSGSDDNWDYFSVQWDGFITIPTNNIHLYSRCEDSSRAWIDADRSGSFETNELIDWNWGGLTGPGSMALSNGTYAIRIQYYEWYGENPMALLWDGDSLGPDSVRAFRVQAQPGKLFFDSFVMGNADWGLYGPFNNVVCYGNSLGDMQGTVPEQGTYDLIFWNLDRAAQPFQFCIQTPENLTNALTLGSNYDLSLLPGQAHFLQFAGVSGQRIYYDSLCLATNTPVFWTLRAPSGDALVSGDLASLDRPPITLTENGIYTLKFENWSDDTNSVPFRILDVAALPCLALDVTNRCVVANGAENRLFRINVPANMRLFLENIEYASLGWGQLNVYNDRNDYVTSGSLGYSLDLQSSPVATSWLLVFQGINFATPYTNAFRVVPANHAPELSVSGNLVREELQTVLLTNLVSDPESDNEQYSFTLINAPSGMSIDSTGVIRWTPSEAEGPGIYPVTVRVADDGIPSLSSTNSFELVVNEVNSAPMLTVPGNQVINELQSLNITASASDSDLPANTLTFALVSGPSGLTVSPSGTISWTPTEAQGPSTNTVAVRVYDNGTPSLSVTNSFEVVVKEVNSSPVLTVPTNQVINELESLNVTAIATDSDSPINLLTFALVSGPTGLTVSPSGAIAWTPTEEQGPSTNQIVVRVYDSGTPSLSASNSFEVVVNEINAAPSLTTPANQVINELALFEAVVAATDADMPANTLTIELVSGPPGLSVSESGTVTWSPTEVQGPSTNTVVVRVYDNGTPSLSTTNSFELAVKEVNVAPTLNVPATQVLDELQYLNFATSATDSDIPANTLTYALVSGPVGFSISPSGFISWAPDETHGPSTNRVVMRVYDDATPSLSTTNSFEVVVREVNSAPVLSVPTNQIINELELLNVTATATDADVPSNSLTFALVNGPSGLTVSPSGTITWTPTEAQAPSTNTVVVRVLDNGTPSLSATNSFEVIVTEANSAPTLTLPGNQTVNELSVVNLTATATDSDVPANALSFALVSGPSGLAVSSSGAITWTPGEAQGPSTNTVVVRVSDDGTPSLSTTNSFQIIVKEVNSVPSLTTPTNQYVNELEPINLSAVATDADIPTNTLTFQVIRGPSGLTISQSGALIWTPTEAQGPSTNIVMVRVYDNGTPSMAVTNGFELRVRDVNSAPNLQVPASRTMNESQSLNVVATATDSDYPANNLTFALVSGPSGLTVSSSGVIKWTPTEAQAPSTNTIVVRVYDDGSPSISVTNSFEVVVDEINAAPTLTVPGNQVLNELETLNVIATATDSDYPANNLAFALVSGPSGLTVSPTGSIDWTPSDTQGPSTNIVVIRVYDDGTPSMSATNSFEVVVKDVNPAVTRTMVLLEDTFDGPSGIPDIAKYGWYGEVTLDGNGKLSLQTWNANQSWIRSRAGATVESDQILTLQFTGVAYAEDRIYGDKQPRGLRVGTDANNAVEFYSVSPTTVGMRTRRNGVESTASCAVAMGVNSMHQYQISVTSTSAVFYIDGVLAATITDNLPGGRLNWYVSTYDGTYGNVPVTIDSVKLSLGNPPIVVPAPLHVDGSSAFRLMFTNAPGTPFSVLGSTNIELPVSEWSVLGPMVEFPAGVFQFTDTGATNRTATFYRLRSP